MTSLFEDGSLSSDACEFGIDESRRAARQYGFTPHERMIFALGFAYGYDTGYMFGHDDGYARGYDQSTFDHE